VLFVSRVREGSGCAQLESAGIAAARSDAAFPTLPSIAFPNHPRQRAYPAEPNLVYNGWETSMGNRRAIKPDKS